jgi:hypothetical protein
MKLYWFIQEIASWRSHPELSKMKLCLKAPLGSLVATHGEGGHKMNK